MIETVDTDVLIVGGGAGATAAAIQSARRGSKTIIVSEFSWLGGMLTTAGVTAPDGNELSAWQTGIWGAYLKALRQRQAGGLDNAWVSMFTYDARIGAEIFRDWVEELPLLSWIQGQTPQEAIVESSRIVAIRFNDYLIRAKIVIDGTELGDVLALAEVPLRWGWELQSEFNEPSAPISFDRLTEKYPVQAPTWVFLLQDYQDQEAPLLNKPFAFSDSPFQSAWDNYGVEKFLNYGRLPDSRFMINWPICGNDYGEGLARLVANSELREEFLQEAYEHSYNFAYFLQQQLGNRYGLAENIFPSNLGNGAFALHPYYRESRRLQGLVTVTEKNILPVEGGAVAALPVNQNHRVSSIALGNYPNDHHYPTEEFILQGKSLRWGGRWTGTPFTIAYEALISTTIDGLLVCEKNISVSHIANGSTRLQPLVMNIGQAAGMAAALCVELNCQPRDLSVRILQLSLLQDKLAPATLVPLFNLPLEHPDWFYWQQHYLDNPELYPIDGNCPCAEWESKPIRGQRFSGVLRVNDVQDYHLSFLVNEEEQSWRLITLNPQVDKKLQNLRDGQLISLIGTLNIFGQWLVVESLI